MDRIIKLPNQNTHKNSKNTKPNSRTQANKKQMKEEKGRREEMLMKMEGGWMISPLEVWNAPR